MAFFERKKHPGAELRNRHLEFIMANWELIANECYKSFLEKGRGVFVVNESDFTEKPKGVLAEIRMVYLAGEKLPTFEPGSKEGKWLGEYGYDPEKTMLVSFLREDGGLSSYNIEGRGDGCPKRVYERYKSKQPVKK